MKIFKEYIRNMGGAAAIEFVFVLPVFLALIFGSIELGYIFWANSALKYAASYGARYAFVHPTASSTEIKNFAFSKVDLSGSVITYTVTITPNVSADIDGSFNYSFIILPLNPITLTTHFHQVLPLTS